MSPLPTGIDILAPNLDWLAAQFAVAIEDIATEDGGRGEVSKTSFSSLVGMGKKGKWAGLIFFCFREKTAGLR